MLTSELRRDLIKQLAIYFSYYQRHLQNLAMSNVKLLTHTHTHVLHINLVENIRKTSLSLGN